MLDAIIFWLIWILLGMIMVLVFCVTTNIREIRTRDKVSSTVLDKGVSMSSSNDNELSIRQTSRDFWGVVSILTYIAGCGLIGFEIFRLVPVVNYGVTGFFLLTISQICSKRQQRQREAIDKLGEKKEIT